MIRRPNSMSALSAARRSSPNREATKRCHPKEIGLFMAIAGSTEMINSMSMCSTEWQMVSSSGLLASGEEDTYPVRRVSMQPPAGIEMQTRCRCLPLLTTVRETCLLSDCTRGECGSPDAPRGAWPCKEASAPAWSSPAPLRGYAMKSVIEFVNSAGTADTSAAPTRECPGPRNTSRPCAKPSRDTARIPYRTMETVKLQDRWMQATPNHG